MHILPERPCGILKDTSGPCQVPANSTLLRISQYPWSLCKDPHCRGIKIICKNLRDPVWTVYHWVSHRISCRVSPVISQQALQCPVCTNNTMFIIPLHNMDRSLHTLWLVTTSCFIGVKTWKKRVLLFFTTLTTYHKATFGHLRTLKKCRKHKLQVGVFYISLVFSNACCVLSQCNICLRLLIC